MRESVNAVARREDHFCGEWRTGHLHGSKPMDKLRTLWAEASRIQKLFAVAAVVIALLAIGGALVG